MSKGWRAVYWSCQSHGDALKKQTLLDEVESFRHSDRVRKMVEVGRAGRFKKREARTIASLENGDVYERWLALHACYGSRDGAHILRALNDESRLVQNLALSLVPVVCDDAEASQALRFIGPTKLDNLVQALRRRKRQKPIDQLIEEWVTSHRRFPELLPYASPPVVERHLGAVLPQMTDLAWQRLGKLHPVLASQAVRELVQRQEQSARLEKPASCVLPHLANADPDAALELARVLSERVPLARLELQRIADLRPVEFADFLLAHADPAFVTFDFNAFQLGLERIQRLFERRPEVLTPVDGITNKWFRRLSSSDQVAIFHTVRASWIEKDGLIPAWKLDRLPRDLQIREARLHLMSPGVRLQSNLQLQYAEYLPWPEPLAFVQPLLHDPEADIRANALRVLLSTLDHGTNHITEVFSYLDQYVNDQDPVRADILSQIDQMAVIRQRLNDEHLNLLGGVIEACLDSSDLSKGSLSLICQILTAAFPQNQEWAGPLLATVFRDRREIQLDHTLGMYSHEDVTSLLSISTRSSPNGPQRTTRP
ncbi:MAG: hypothetical protein ACJ789_05870 [Thermomicrobiales bacterium]